MFQSFLSAIKGLFIKEQSDPTSFLDYALQNMDKLDELQQELLSKSSTLGNPFQSANALSSLNIGTNSNSFHSYDDDFHHDFHHDLHDQIQQDFHNQQFMERMHDPYLNL
ncbi:MAG TPA: hypothetical protein VFX34_03070, partial [Sporosarcina sp.]|nr:hypothetical protein [Sporosarcina sp.]